MRNRVSSVAPDRTGQESPRSPRPDFATVTEIAGGSVTREAWEMICARYRFVGELSQGRRVLEVACGTGQGIGHIGQNARTVVAGDMIRTMLQQTRLHCGSRVALVNFDAEDLPFVAGSFDVVVLLEAIYYLPEPERFFAEAHRLLSDDGKLVICSANPERRDFNSSPFAHRYFTAMELQEMMVSFGFSAEVFGAFPVRRHSFRDAVIYLARRLAVALHLMPRTMRGKAWLKRLAYGELVAVKPEIDDGPPPVLVPVGSGQPADCRVIYAVGRRRNRSPDDIR